ncbi:MAG TPA: Hsp70 family protein, partial [Ktedonobacteraceae bacterium]|nr:Hsp70 family protein [Ktedonobacteraceae bacterium]
MRIPWVAPLQTQGSVISRQVRQGDGADLLGQGDPRSADIGMLYVRPEDSRQEILTAINAQQLLGRKQIAIVLPEQGKAFRQPMEFDGLKNMRRGLKAQLILIAPSGPGPAEFARQRRFLVYSSLETFKAALLDDRVPSNPRAKAAGDEKKPGFLGRSRANKRREQNPSPTPRIQPAASVQSVMPPTPLTSHLGTSASEAPVTPPTPRIAPGTPAQPESPNDEQAQNRQARRIIFGIDFGAIYSCISYVNKHGQALIIPNRNGDYRTRSAITFDANKLLIGEVFGEKSVIL